jgi:hypothetical protein
MRYYTLRTARSLGLDPQDLAVAAYERFKKTGEIPAAVIFINGPKGGDGQPAEAETFIFSNVEARGVLRRVCGAHAREALLRLSDLMEQADPEKHIIIAVLRPFTPPLVDLLLPDPPPPAAYAARVQQASVNRILEGVGSRETRTLLGTLRSLRD